ncbi:Ectoine hydrolase [bacterium HR40]|nr:Ectoine hydrolase [bacterium HR40]
MIHFEQAEFDRRRHAVLASMAREGLDGLLLFDPASHYWLTGYDSFGYCFFQCMVVRADGDLTLLTRAPDLRQARQTSLVRDIRIWVDRADADPVRDLRAVLQDKRLAGGRLGVEWDTHGLTAANGRRLEAGLEGFATLADASLLVRRLRLVKSEAELAFVRRAAELADAALDAAISQVRPGADEGAILARMHDAIFEGDGDYPANPFIIGSGEKALLCRYASGRRRLAARDQLTLEFAGVFRQYHACSMRTLLVGAADDRHRRMFDACRQALLSCEERLVPGRTMGEVYAAHAETFDRLGYGPHRLNACGYSLGAVYAPSWMDWPMFYADNPVEIAPGMVFFLHMILFDDTTGHAMTLGRTSVVGPHGAQPLSRHPLELLVL